MMLAGENNYALCWQMDYKVCTFGGKKQNKAEKQSELATLFLSQRACFLFLTRRVYTAAIVFRRANFAGVAK